MNRSIAYLIACLIICVGQCHGAINAECNKALTASDPHLSAYVGKVFTIVDAVHDDTNEKYTYSIGVCTTPDISDGNPVLSDCAVVQTDTKNSVAKNTCAGRVTQTQVARTKDGVWIELTYSGGNNYTSHCGRSNRVARLIFLCDPLVQGLGKFDFLEESRDGNVCFYTFSLAAKGVCGYTLSPGDIIIIIVACLLVVWVFAMIGGCLFKRFIQGAKGMEQIPLIEWYREFGNLEADGCDLICRSKKRVVREYREPTFGADTDDEDDEKDDNLLPM